MDMETFRPETHRDHLMVLAQVQLRRAGFLQRKIDAADIVQEVLLQAHLALPQFRGNTEPEFKGWLRSILASKLADAARRLMRKKRDPALEASFRQCLEGSVRFIEDLIPDDRTSPSQHLLRDERALRLAAALGQLPADQRTAVECCHLEGCSVIETAARMQRTVAGVAGLLRRGMKALRETLAESAP
jgi:RNA polymerase sigma-70 factor, ECF subfamily